MNYYADRRRNAAARDAALARRLRILVADDNRDTVLTLLALLRDEGHDAHGAYTGAEALKASRLNSYDAMILDIELPELSGYAIAQEIRALYHGSARPPLLIAISGKWNKASEKLLSRTVGFDHHLEKPWEPNALIKLLAPLTMPSGTQRMTNETSYMRNLRGALATLDNDETVLAAVLGVSRETLANWLSGQAPPTVDSYLKVLDILVNGPLWREGQDVSSA